MICNTDYRYVYIHLSSIHNDVGLLPVFYLRGGSPVDVDGQCQSGQRSSLAGKASRAFTTHWMFVYMTKRYK